MCRQGGSPGPPAEGLPLSPPLKLYMTLEGHVLSSTVVVKGLWGRPFLPYLLTPHLPCLWLPLQFAPRHPPSFPCSVRTAKHTHTGLKGRAVRVQRPLPAPCFASWGPSCPRPPRRPLPAPWPWEPASLAVMCASRALGHLLSCFCLICIGSKGFEQPDAQPGVPAAAGKPHQQQRVHVRDPLSIRQHRLQGKKHPHSFSPSPPSPGAVRPPPAPSHVNPPLLTPSPLAHRLTQWTQLGTSVGRGAALDIGHLQLLQGGRAGGKEKQDFFSCTKPG